MLFSVNNLVQLDNIGVRNLSPYLSLIVNGVQVVYHLHLSLCRVPDSSLLLKKRFVHHFHREILFDIPVCGLIFPQLAVGPFPEDPLDFGERTFAYVVKYLELVHKLCLSFNLYFDLISEINRFLNAVWV